MDKSSLGSPKNIIDPELVNHIAYLIRLKISEAEAELFSQQFSMILDYFQKLEEFDTPVEGILDEDFPLKNVFREDSVTPSMSRDEFLANAPLHEGSYLKIPHVFSDR